MIGELELRFAKTVTSMEIGDGELLEKWLDWLGSEGFKEFVNTLIKLVKAIIEIIDAICVSNQVGPRY